MGGAGISLERGVGMNETRKVITLSLCFIRSLLGTASLLWLQLLPGRPTASHTVLGDLALPSATPPPPSVLLA